MISLNEFINKNITAQGICDVCNKVDAEHFIWGMIPENVDIGLGFCDECYDYLEYLEK